MRDARLYPYHFISNDQDWIHSSLRARCIPTPQTRDEYVGSLRGVSQPLVADRK